MSLVSRKAIQKAGPDRKNEKIVTFRCNADKTYTKVTKTVTRDWKTGLAKSMKRLKPVEEGPFELTNDESSYDESMSYEDYDGTVKHMYFKYVGPIEDE